MVAATSILRERIRQCISSQQQPTVTMLSSLLIVQDELGYIPQEAIEEIAKYSDSTINDVWGVASFYTNFRFDPPLKHQIEICWGPTCHLKNAPDIIQFLQNCLDLTSEGDSEKADVTLRYSTCLGVCAQAPAVSLDHKLYGNLTIKKAEQLIGELFNQEKK